MYDGHNNWIRDLCVFGKYMGSASEDRTIRVWEINTAATVAVLTGHSSGVRALIEVRMLLLSFSVFPATDNATVGVGAT